MNNKKVLNLEIKRVNNTVNGNPRFRVIDWDNEELLDTVIKNGFIRDLKKGYFTKSDAMDCYKITNSEGIVVDNITIISKVVY